MRLSVVLGVLAGFAIGLAAGLLLAGILRTVRPEEVRLAEELKAAKKDAWDHFLENSQLKLKQINDEEWRQATARSQLFVNAFPDRVKKEFARIRRPSSLIWELEGDPKNKHRWRSANKDETLFVTVEEEGTVPQKVTLMYRVPSEQPGRNADAELREAIAAFVASVQTFDGAEEWLFQAVTVASANHHKLDHPTISCTRLGTRLSVRVTPAFGLITITADNPSAEMR